MKQLAPAPLALLLALAGLTGCVLKSEVVGNTYPAGDDTSTSAGSSSSDTDGMTGLTGGDTEDALAYGDACELATPLVQVTALSEQPLCPGQLCLLVHDEIPPSCATDDDCAEASPDHGECNENDLCGLSPAYIDDHARCTQTCEDVSECPPIPGCESGPTCVVIARLGAYCCQKICACADEVDVGTAMERELQCSDPGACS